MMCLVSKIYIYIYTCNIHGANVTKVVICQDLQKFNNVCPFGLLYVWAVLNVPRQN